MPHRNRRVLPPIAVAGDPARAAIRQDADDDAVANSPLALALAALEETAADEDRGGRPVPLVRLQRRRYYALDSVGPSFRLRVHAPPRRNTNRDASPRRCGANTSRVPFTASVRRCGSPRARRALDKEIDTAVWRCLGRDLLNRV